MTSVSFSGDGKLIVSGSGDRTVRVWNAVTGTCLQTLEGHTEDVISVSFSGDGKLIVSGSDDRTVRVWNAVSGECVLGPLEGHTDWVTSVSFSGDGKLIVSGSGDRTVRVWNAVSGECVRVIEGTSAIPSDIEVSNVGDFERDLSIVNGNTPAGIDFRKAYIIGSTACATEGSLVHILKLMPK